MLGHGSDQVIYLTKNKQVNCSVSKSCSSLWFDRNTLLPSVDAEISLQKVRWIFVLILAPFPYFFCLFFLLPVIAEPLERECEQQKTWIFVIIFSLLRDFFCLFCRGRITKDSNGISPHLPDYIHYYLFWDQLKIIPVSLPWNNEFYRPKWGLFARRDLFSSIYLLAQTDR